MNSTKNLTYAKRAVKKANDDAGYTMFVIKNDKNVIFTVRRLIDSAKPVAERTIDNCSNIFFNAKSDAHQSIDSFIADNIEI